MPIDNRRIPGPESTQPVVRTENKGTLQPLIDGEGLRKDGRKADELRPMFLRTGVVNQARGSAYIEMRHTKVTCAVYGPRESPRHQEFSGKGKLTCEFKFAPFSCWQRRQHVQDSEEKEFSSFVVQALEPAVLLYFNWPVHDLLEEKFPKAQVDVYITVLENDGNALSAGILCASLALAQAGIEMYDLVSACSLAQRESLLLLDPTVSEIQSSEVGGQVTIAFLPTMNIVSGLLQDGELSHDHAVKAIKSCMEGSVRIYPVLQETLVDSVSRAIRDKQSS